MTHFKNVYYSTIDLSLGATVPVIGCKMRLDCWSSQRRDACTTESLLKQYLLCGEFIQCVVLQWGASWFYVFSISTVFHHFWLDHSSRASPTNEWQNFMIGQKVISFFFSQVFTFSKWIHANFYHIARGLFCLLWSVCGKKSGLVRQPKSKNVSTSC